MLQKALEQQIERWWKYGSPLPPPPSGSSDSSGLSDPAAPTVYDARGNGDGQTVPTVTGDHNSRITDYTALVCFSQDAYDKYTANEHASTIKATGGCYGGGSEVLVCAGFSPKASAGSGSVSFEEGRSPTLQVGKEMGVVTATEKAGATNEVQYTVRRLTPLECCRLQGMPDSWTSDVPHSDAQEYRMFGNGMALPNALYVMEGIAECEHTTSKEGLADE